MEDFSSNQSSNGIDKIDDNDKISELRNSFFDEWNRGCYNEAKKWASYGMYYCFKNNIEQQVDHFRALIEYADSNYNNAEELLAGIISNISEQDDITICHIQAYEDYALFLFEVYKYREAYGCLFRITRLYKKLSLTPSIRFFTRAAMICESLEKHKDREHFLLQAKEVDPDNYLFLTNYMVMKWDQYYTAHDNDPYKEKCLSEMLEVSDKLLKHVARPEEDAILMNNVGALCYLQKKYKKSIEYLKKALAINSELPLVCFNKGLAEFRLGEYEDAEKSFRNASLFYRKENNIGRSKNASLFVNICQMKTPEDAFKNEEDKGFLSFLFEFVDTLDNSENFFIGRFVSDSQFQKEFLRKGKHNGETNNLYFLRGKHAHYPPLMPVQHPIGGGYFLKWKNRGIVIDPGYHFIRNFLENRLSIIDIDTIILSSAEADHTADFETILLILKTINDLRAKAELGDDSIESFIKAKLPHSDQNINLILTHDAIKKYKMQIKRVYRSLIKNVSVFDPNGKAVELETADINGQESKIRILPIENKIAPGVRDDRPFGFIMELYGNHDNGLIRLGYTSDTQWSKDIERFYQNCRIIIAHMGPIKSNEFRAKGPRVEKLSNQHLGLYGCYRIIKFVQPKLLFIGDLGAELGRRKGKVIAHFNNPGFYNNSNMNGNKTVSTEIGMILDLEKRMIKTKEMSDFVSIDNIEEKFDLEQDRYRYI